MAENIINKDLRTHADVFNDLYANAPSRTAYNVGVNADLANRVSQGLGSIPGIGPALSAVADVAMPAGAFALSPAYDTLQGISRAGSTYSNQGPYAGIVDDTQVPAGPTLGQIGQAIANEKIGQTMFERMVGASAPLANRISNFNAPSIMGRAQAAEVTPPNTISGNFGTPGSIISDGPGKYEVNPDGKTASLIGRSYDMSNVAGLGDLGNPTGDSRVVSEELGMTGRPTTGRPSMADIAGQINENLMDRGNPLGDSRVVSEEQGLSGFPGLGQVDPGFQNELDAREARRGEIAMQQNPDYGQFFDAPAVNEQKRGLDLGMLGMLAGPLGMFTGSNALRGIGLLSNIASGRAGRAVDAVSRGLGSLGSRISGSMRGINPATGRPNTQAQYEADRARSQTVGRVNNMMARKAAGKSYSQKNLDRLSAEISASRDPNQGNTVTGFGKSGMGRDTSQGGGDTGASSGKIVCTMMNERYGFGSFRNKIWMKFHENHGPEYQKGYHAIFLPLVKIAKGEGKINTAVRKVLEHMGRHVTADMFKIMKGKKRDTLGRIYRAIFEPACHIIGKIKSALGRG